MALNILLFLFRRTWLGIFLGAVAFYAAYWLGNPGYTNWFTIKGVPFSDAARWHEMARNFAGAQEIVGGWSAQRPFYSITLGAVYGLLGPDFSLAIIANILFYSVSVALAYLIGAHIFNRTTGYVAAVFFLLNPVQRDILFTITTEPLGLMLLLLALLCLLLALHRGPGWWALTGVLLALSEMTRPLALGLLPGMLLLSIYRTRRWKYALARVAVLYAGFILTALPWAIRQKIKHGFWGITDDTYESLFATSSPEFGSWDEWIRETPDNLGITTVADRIAYFRGEFFRNLSEHPEVYFGNVRRAFLEFLQLPVNDFLAQPRPLYLAVAGWLAFVMLLRLLYRRHSRSGPGYAIILLGSAVQVALAGLAVAMIYRHSFAVLLTALALIAWRSWKDHRSFAFLTVFFFAALSLSLVNETNDYRFLAMTYWLHEMAHAWFIALLIGLGTRWFGLSAAMDAQVRDRLPPAGLIPAGFGLAVLFLGVAYVHVLATPERLPRISAGDVHDRVGESMPAVMDWLGRQGLADSAEASLAYFSDPAIVLKDDLVNHGEFWLAVGVPGDKIFRLDAGEAVDHTARLFTPRPYAHDVLMEDYFAVVFEPGTLNAYRDDLVLLVNRVNIDTNYIQYEERRLNENIAIIPLADDGVPDTARAYVSRNPDHLDVLRALQHYSLQTTDSTEAVPANHHINYFNVALQ